MAKTLTLTGNITVSSGSTGDTPEILAIAAPTISGTVIADETLSLSSGANAITLPIAQVLGFYLQDLHATQTITVTWTPQGGASILVKTLATNEILFFMSAAGTGISALNLNASGAATTCRLILFG